MRTIKKILGFVLCCCSVMCYSQTDTIYNRYKHYYYTSWYDSCYAAGAHCNYADFLEPNNPCIGNYAPSAFIQGVYHHTNTPLEILGVVGGVIKTEFTDSTRVPEYFMVFDDISNGEWTLIDSARWDTAEIKYMALETQSVSLEHRLDTIDGVVYLVDYYDTVRETKYMKICEAYFKSPITVNDSFLLGATSFNNVRPGDGEPGYDCADYIHEPTEYPTNFFSYCVRYSPIWTYHADYGGWGKGLNMDYNGYYYVMFPIIKVLDTFEIMGMSHDETQGTVEGSGEYIKNSRVELTAIAAEGYKFVMWNDSVTDNPRVFYASQDTTFTAYFAPLEQYTLRVVSNNPIYGTVTGGGVYNETTPVEISAEPTSELYRFVHWNDSVTDNPRIIVLTQDTLFTAYFDTDVSITEAEIIENLFTLSPNPTAKDLQIHLNRSGNYTMVIYTSAGVEIKKQPISEPTTINCTELTPGTYIIKIYNDECAGVKSFVKQ